MNAKKMPLKDHENILVFYRKLPVYNPQKTAGAAYKHSYDASKLCSTNYGDAKEIETVSTVMEGRYPKSTIRFSRDSDKKHPTQKPVALFEYLIRTYTNEGDIVLDNCLGSGTTAVAAINTNRQFIGIEREPEYVAIANQRISDAKQSKEGAQ